MKKSLSKAAFASDATSKAYHAQSRARVAELAAKGQGQSALAEGLAALGIDVKAGTRPKIVGYNGIRFRA